MPRCSLLDCLLLERYSSGNVIGTNVTIVTLALGLSALIFPLTIDRKVRRKALITTLVSIIPVVLLFLGVVTQLEGVLLLLVFIGYTLFLFRTDREASKRLAESEADGDDDESHSRPRLLPSLVHPFLPS